MVDSTGVVYHSTDENIVTTIPSSHKKAVVLTFDDGPSRVLPRILDILKHEKVPAIFFWQTRLLYSSRPWNRVLEEGHQIGSHTTKHSNLAKLSYQQQYQDIKRSINQIELITNRKVTYFRPPFGQCNEDTLKVAKELGLTIVMWKIASIDWECKTNPQQIITNIVDNLEDGAVILLHELKQTMEALPDLIKAVRDKGYSFTGLNNIQT